MLGNSVEGRIDDWFFVLPATPEDFQVCRELRGPFCNARANENPHVLLPLDQRITFFACSSARQNPSATIQN
jgi:hypothetical protein